MGKQVVQLVGFILVVLTGLFIWQTLGQNSAEQLQMAPNEDPMDVTMELYRPWFAGLQSTSTEFDKMEVLNSAPLTTDLRTRLQAETVSETGIDPIMCQPELPERIGTKTIFVTDVASQVAVVPRGVKVPEQALVTLEAVNGEWVISDITCSRGELAPDLEFTFDREGNLLKQSLQPPLDNEQWHLIYTKDGVAGNAIPLLFAATSVCIQSDDGEQVCEPDQLTEAAAVQVQGAMQEAGVLVERMRLQ